MSNHIGTSLAYVVDVHVDLLCSLVTDLDNKRESKWSIDVDAWKVGWPIIAKLEQ